MNIYKAIVGVKFYSLRRRIVLFMLHCGKDFLDNKIKDCLW